METEEAIRKGARQEWFWARCPACGREAIHADPNRRAGMRFEKCLAVGVCPKCGESLGQGEKWVWVLNGEILGDYEYPAVEVTPVKRITPMMNHD